MTSLCRTCPRFALDLAGLEAEGIVSKVFEALGREAPCKARA